MTWYPSGNHWSRGYEDVGPAKAHKVLVVDTGGTNIKLLVSGQKEPRKFPPVPR